MKFSYLLMLLSVGIFSFTLILNPIYAQVSCPDCELDDPRVIAQESLEDHQILLWTDKTTYDHNDSIVVEGIVTNIVSGVPITLTVMSPLNSIITIDSLLVDNDGSFGTILSTANNLWKYDGTYTIKANYGIAEKNTSVQVKLIGGVDSGSSNTTPESTFGIIGKTSQNYYENGDRVIVTGSITNFDYSAHSDIALTYQVQDSIGNIVTIGKTFPNPKGTFSFDFVAGGSLFKESGTYYIELGFSSATDDISFKYTGGTFEPSNPTSPTFDPRGSSDTIIIVTIHGDSIFYLDSPNAIIRATVDILDFSPSDGLYFMKVTHIPTQKVLKDFEIYPKFLGDEMWGTQIAYPIQDTDIQFGGQSLYGEYRIDVTSEYGGQTGRDSFFIFESQTNDLPIAKIPEWVKSNAKWWADGLIDDQTFVSGIQFLIKEKILNVSTVQSSTSNTNSQIPEWIKTNADWWARGLITENDFLKGIEYLVKNEIIDVSKKSPTIAIDDDEEILKLFEEGLISESEFKERLAELGYDPEEIRQAQALIGKLEHQKGFQTPLKAPVKVQGTDFELTYAISGGVINQVVRDYLTDSLIIQIDTVSDGTLAIKLPREVIDAKFGEKDIDFIVLLDGLKTIFAETKTGNERTLTIEIISGAEEIKIIGSFVS